MESYSSFLHYIESLVTVAMLSYCTRHLSNGSVTLQTNKLFFLSLSLADSIWEILALLSVFWCQVDHMALLYLLWRQGKITNPTVRSMFYCRNLAECVSIPASGPALYVNTNAYYQQMKTEFNSVQLHLSSTKICICISWHFPCGSGQDQPLLFLPKRKH